MESIFDEVSHADIHKCLLKTADVYHISSIEVAQEMGKRFFSRYREYNSTWVLEEPTKTKGSNTPPHMNILVTGVRPGETIIGIYGFNKGSVVKLIKGVIRPYSGFINELRYNKEVWKLFLRNLGSIPFFEPLTLKEREIYLLEMQTDRKYSQFSDIQGIKIQVLQLGKGKQNKFLSLSSESIEKIMSGGTVSAQKIRDIFPQVPGSKGKTLVFYSKGWRISTDYHEVEKYSGLVYDVATGGLSGSASGKILVLNFVGDQNQKLGFKIPRGQMILTKNDIFNIVLQKFPIFEVEDVEKIEYACRTFTSASYKSLIQKTIRFRPKKVNISLFGKDLYPTDFFLAVILSLALINPGSFVPSIQRYVSGLESGVKRLAVTILEDSYIEDSLKLVGLFSSALLSQRVKSWTPSEEMVSNWIDVSIEAYREIKHYDWNVSKGLELSPFILSGDLKPLESCSFLLDEIKSLKGDYGMVRDIASKNTHGTEPQFDFISPRVMNISHCVDFHWAPEFVYFLDQNTVNKYSEPGSKPFRKIFEKVFNSVTGFDPRKTPLEKMVKNRFTEEVEKSQKLLLISRRSSPVKKTEIPDDYYTFDMEIEDAWLAGMMGAVEIKLKKEPVVLVTLLPRDIYQFVVIKRPSRGMKDATVSPNLEFKASEHLRNLLQTKGVPLDKSTPPVQELKGAVLYLKDDEYYVKVKNSLVKWSTVKKIKSAIPVVDKSPPSNLKETLVNSTNGNYILRDWKGLLRLQFLQYDRKVWMRLLTFASKYTKEIELPRISRDGGATKQSVFVEDISVYQLLLRLSNIVPAALTRRSTNTLGFIIHNSLMWWKVRDLIEKESRHEEEIGGNWVKIEENLGREPWKHQEEILEEIIERNKKGKKGIFLHLTVGLGKTFIVMSFLRYLQSTKQLPKYIIYTLPTSAIKSILHEVEAFNFKPDLLMPIQTIGKNHPYLKYIYKSKTPRPFKLTLISHDHLRKCKNELMDISSESIFIIDEVHKALNETIRTSVALTISKLSQNFIALTGTPIIDTHTYKLIWWLSQIVYFEVNERNFWVAANGMVSRKINTGIITETIKTEAPFREKERDVYTNLVSRSIGGRNPNPSFSDLLRATQICYKASTREIVKRTIHYIETEKNGVMIVAHNKSHQEEILDQLARKIDRNDIFLIDKDNTLFFTDEMVEGGKVPDYKVVITTLRKSEGYTLTRLSVMITGVYPSNNANREQLEGRINRIGQKKNKVVYEVIHTGILTYIMKKHLEAKSLSDVLKTLAETVG